MSEGRAVERTGREPVIADEIVRDLRALGVRAGEILIVHSSLSALGWVVGGALTVVDALLEVLGPPGTLVMPAHSTQLGDPALWTHTSVPASWLPVIRARAPAYDPRRTPTYRMGAIVDTFLRTPGVERSAHPLYSCAAHGPRAEEVLEPHPLADGSGEAGPIGRLYALDARVLLLGVGYANNTSLHLAEHRAAWPGKRRVRNGAPLVVDGERRWVEFEELDGDTSDFETLGADFGRRAAQGPVGRATALLMRQRELVDFATTWFETHR